VLPGVKRPALRRATLATGDAIRSLIHHVEIATRDFPSNRPVLMLQTPSCSMMVIGTAPLAARYATARFRFGAFASMAAVDTEISGRRQKAPGFKPSLRPN
jgi:hypothetical protein